MDFALKNMVFFGKIIVGYKNENQRSNRGLKIVKILKEKKECANSKNISKTFSGGVVGSVGSVHFWIVSWSGLYFSKSIGPFLYSRY